MRSSEVLSVMHKDLVELKARFVTPLIICLLSGVFLPLFVLSARDFSSGIGRKIESLSYKVGLDGKSEVLREFLSKEKQLELSSISTKESAAKAIASGTVDVVLHVPDNFDRALEDKRSSTLEVLADSRYELSMLGSDCLLRRLKELKFKQAADRLAEIGLGGALQPEYEFVDVDAALQRSHLSHHFAGLYLMLVFFSVFAAAASTSIELVTGETERRTLEMLLLTPCDRRSIMVAKLLIVFAASLFCGFLTTLTFSARFLQANLSEISLAQLLLLLVQSAPMVTLLALFVSCLQVLISAYSKTIQQASGYTFYSLLLLMIPASAPISSQVAFSPAAAFLPVANLSIGTVEILRGRAEWPWIGATLISSLVYCFIVLRPVPAFLEKEEHLFNLGISPETRRKRGEWGKELLLLFAIAFLLMFYAGQFLIQWNPLPGLVLTQLLCVLLPALIFLLVFRLPVAETLSLTPCKLRQVLGAALLAPATVCTASLLFLLQSMFMPAPESFLKDMINFLIPKQTPIWMLLAVAGLTPGVCEEILFRGLFLGLLRRSLSGPSVCLTVGLIFGVFHFSVFRFLPTAALGVILSAIVLRTGSLFPAMALHASHNSLALWCASNPHLLGNPVAWMTAAACGLAGLRLLGKQS